jgi:aspartyl-tRNA(Asn)/glutamyl-tRNA(Gln) amidotransferase subunit B
MNNSAYEMNIGLEIHVQFNTRSKLFCADPVAFGAEPNTLVSAVSLGWPGALPSINKEAITKAIMFGLAVNSSFPEVLQFDRKNYFYPDLPKGYQITQQAHPICQGGALAFRTSTGAIDTVALHHAHLEEDAGKSIHDAFPEHTAIDLNRAGTPLLEIVTEPVLTSARQAADFLAELRRLVRFLGICDGNMEEGSIRCDANVSVRPAGSAALGTRCEIKNLNSVKFLEKAIETEQRRQLEAIAGGKTIAQETRGYDANGDFTFSLRGKESAHDYRYFPDPDLPVITLKKEWVTSLSSFAAPSPLALEQTLLDQGIGPSEAAFLTAEPERWQWWQRYAKGPAEPQKYAAWLLGPLRAWMNEHGSDFQSLKLLPEMLNEIIAIVAEGVMSPSLAADRLLPMVVEGQKVDLREVIDKNNWAQSSDEDDIRQQALKVLAEWPEKVKGYKKGNKGLLGLFMGELMKRCGGNVNPKLASDILQQLLAE